MPLYEITGLSELEPIPHSEPDEHEYRRLIASLLWRNPEPFVGRPLLPVALSPDIGTEDRPDIVLLDAEGRVVLVEITREGDRSQLAYFVDHVAWAANMPLDACAAVYHGGADAFAEDFRAFAGTDPPQRAQRPPWLVLVAQDLLGRDIASFTFLLETAVVLRMVRAVTYVRYDGKTMLAIERED